MIFVHFFGSAGASAIEWVLSSGRYRVGAIEGVLSSGCFEKAPG